MSLQQKEAREAQEPQEQYKPILGLIGTPKEPYLDPAEVQAEILAVFGEGWRDKDEEVKIEMEKVARSRLHMREMNKDQIDQELQALGYRGKFSEEPVRWLGAKNLEQEFEDEQDDEDEDDGDEDEKDRDKLEGERIEDNTTGTVSK